MTVGVISGSGSYNWPGLGERRPREIQTPYGTAQITEGTLAGVAVAHLSRHGPGHARLSHQVTHRANLAALRQAGVDRLIALTVCGAVDPSLAPGSLVVFDDLYFPSNRLPDGAICSWYDEPGAAGRGHWIFDRPFSEPIREALLSAAGGTGSAAAGRAGVPVRDGGCYGHVDGPRFNSRAEIAALAGVGVSAVSQTAGPEVVLAGEAELPMALLGFVTDYANGVAVEPEPVDALRQRMAASTAILAEVVEKALPVLATATPAGIVYRFDT